MKGSTKYNYVYLHDDTSIKLVYILHTEIPTYKPLKEALGIEPQKIVHLLLHIIYAMLKYFGHTP